MTPDGALTLRFEQFLLLIKKLTERQLWDLLVYERSHLSRDYIVRRLYGRFCRLRALREQREIFGKSKSKGAK